jgi:murein L,D-transpeptidase YafK
MKKLAFIILALIIANNCWAQPNSKTGVVTYDSRGNKVKKVRKKNGTVVTSISLGPVIDRPFNPDTIDKDHVVLQVYKKYDRMYIYYKGKFLTAFHCVFGKNKMGQKYREGDKKTPEGWFSITDVRKHGKWAYFMGIDYPNATSRENHAMAKSKGWIPSSARIGGSVGIHGVWKGGDMAVKNKFHWTDGCVSLNNKNVGLLSRIVKPGTRIWIGWEK